MLGRSSGGVQRRHRRLARRRAHGPQGPGGPGAPGLRRSRAPGPAFESAWFAGTDLVVCLDRGHRQTLLSLARANAGDDRYDDRLVMLRQFDPRAGGAVDVPDPYYGDDADFEACLDLVEAGCRGLVEHLAAAGRRHVRRR